MSLYRVVPLDETLVWRVRASLRAPDWRLPAYVETASEPGPCRCCLRPFRVGVERHIVFTYDPFRRREPYPLPSPVQIHEGVCSPYTGGRIPADLADRPLTIEGYGEGRQLIVEERHAGGIDLVAEVCRVLGREPVSYIHLRDTGTGFFICELVRNQG